MFDRAGRKIEEMIGRLLGVIERRADTGLLVVRNRSGTWWRLAAIVFGIFFVGYVVGGLVATA